jgi:hypothetical protein
VQQGGWGAQHYHVPTTAEQPYEIPVPNGQQQYAAVPLVETSTTDGEDSEEAADGEYIDIDSKAPPALSKAAGAAVGDHDYMYTPQGSTFT